MASTRIASFVATTVLGLTAPLSGQVAPPSADPALPARPAAAELFSLGLRGVYFVENQGQWRDASVHYGLKSRGLDVAFRESSFTMHLARECASTSRAREEAGFAPSPGSAGEGRRGGELLHHTNYEFNLSLEREALLPHGRGSSGEPAEYEHLTLTVSFPGSNPVAPRGAQPQTAKFNYFVGGEGRGIASNVPSFGAVIYENLYNGIDLLVCGNDDGVMKYEFHCAPGADYSQIRIHYDGIDPLCVNADGDLEIATSFGTLRDGAPIVWQEEDGSTSRARKQAVFTPSPGSAGEGRGGGASTSRAGKEAVFDVVRAAPLADTRGSSGAMRTTLSARFELVDAHTYRIALDAASNPAQPLVIDPEVEWMYYFGGSDQDWGVDVAVDDDHALMTGFTASTDFAGRNNQFYGGLSDAFLVKVNASGELLWMTYLGGTGPDGIFDLSEAAIVGVAVDGAGSALVSGTTASTDFAGALNFFHGGESDAFALKVDPDGQLLWMIYLGGSGREETSRIAVDSNDNALLTGETTSSNFEGRINSPHGDDEGFIVKVSPLGELSWMTYIGGSEGEESVGIAVDSANSAFVTGWTVSTDFTGSINSNNGEQDGYLVKVHPSGQLLWMLYIGGSADEEAFGVAVDRDGNALVTGLTESVDFTGRNNQYQGGDDDAFMLKIDPSGQLLWMTYVGGSESGEAGIAVAVDTAGDALVAGVRDITDLLEADALVFKVSASGQFRWSTVVGGTDREIGFGVALDGGTAFIVGLTESADFAGRKNAYYGGPWDAFLVRLRVDDVVPSLTVAATCPSGGPIQIEWSGASPDGQVALIFARNTGSFIIPNNRPCAGTQLGLGSNQIQIVYNGHAGVNGSRTLNTTAGPGACGGYLQLLDLTTCGTSNVARVE
ncbi:MAG: SBBP repeat-containing protein [Phycisphaerales bacterium]|nr:SBBP repeat-containing protein [Phycisphaerales bacterium]